MIMKSSLLLKHATAPAQPPRQLPHLDSSSVTIFRPIRLSSPHPRSAVVVCVSVCAAEVFRQNNGGRVGSVCILLRVVYLFCYPEQKRRWILAPLRHRPLGEGSSTLSDLWTQWILGAWEVVGSKGTIEYSPFPVPHKGLPARF
ncbi:abscisic acid 8'-hydroxylase [Striga asiatica]|uniref:Abscisic acid 8'-hydroxylase n=1 Tax=Striga asiatica TaxID=4170 RepID=A0A5A7PC86_STRAF|nr:abscisic acid 8'-hydroxylase [Striga asiatica]